MLRHRAVGRRLFAGMLALWFALVAAGGERVHACAMHGGAVVSAQADASAPAPHGADAPAAHDDAHAAHRGGHDAATAPVAATTDSHHGDGAHQCSCPDEGCATAVTAIAAPRVSAHFGIAVADVRAVFAPAVDHQPVAVPHLRPFANGPPARALA